MLLARNWGQPHCHLRLVFDFMFYVVIIVCLLNMIFGIIIDTFGMEPLHRLSRSVGLSRGPRPLPSISNVAPACASAHCVPQSRATGADTRRARGVALSRRMHNAIHCTAPHITTGPIAAPLHERLQLEGLEMVCNRW